MPNDPLDALIGRRLDPALAACQKHRRGKAFMLAGLRHDMLTEIVAKPSGVIDGGFAKAAQRPNLRAHAFERPTL
jgi:hypothetical protein